MTVCMSAQQRIFRVFLVLTQVSDLNQSILSRFYCINLFHVIILQTSKKIRIIKMFGHSDTVYIKTPSITMRSLSREDIVRIGIICSLTLSLTLFLLY